MKHLIKATFIVGAVGLISALVLSACATQDNTQSAANASVMSPTPLSGAQLWANNCSRCHNSRSPSSYSDGEWEIVAMHMRIQANLTGEEHRKILEFIQLSN